MNFEYIVFTVIIAVLIFIFTGGKSQNREKREPFDGVERSDSALARQKKAKKLKSQ